MRPGPPPRKGRLRHERITIDRSSATVRSGGGQHVGRYPGSGGTAAPPAAGPRSHRQALRGPARPGPAGPGGRGVEVPLRAQLRGRLRADPDQVPQPPPGRTGAGPLASRQPDRDRDLLPGRVQQPGLVLVAVHPADRGDAERLPGPVGGQGRPARARLLAVHAERPGPARHRPAKQTRGSSAEQSRRSIP